MLAVFAVELIVEFALGVLVDGSKLGAEAFRLANGVGVFDGCRCLLVQTSAPLCLSTLPPTSPTSPASISLSFLSFAGPEGTAKVEAQELCLAKLEFRDHAATGIPFAPAVLNGGLSLDAGLSLNPALLLTPLSRAPSNPNRPSPNLCPSLGPVGALNGCAGLAGPLGGDPARPRI